MTSHPSKMTVKEVELDFLAPHWAEIAVWSPRSTGWGTINQTFFVGGPENIHLLKLYGAAADPAQLHYEHRLLTDLHQASLPFLVPFPCSTASGETLVPTGEGFASLFPLLTGEAVHRGSIRHTRQAGSALGALHRELSALTIAPEDAVLPPWGDLAKVHPLVPNVQASLGEIGLRKDSAEELGRLVAEVTEFAAVRSVTLPRQITHADYLWPNLLFHHGSVSAVIDFEFATYDLRAFDFAGSLYHFGMLPWKEGGDWDLLEAFGRGYSEQVSLIPEEVEALPMLLRWQQTSSLIYWIGIYLQGLTSRQSLVEAAEGNLLLEKWLAAHSQQLLKRSSA